MAFPRPTLLPFTLLPLLASCVAPQSAAPAPAPAPVSAPAPSRPAPVVAERYDGDWSTADLTPGEWTYARSRQGSFASFGADGGAPLAMIECDGRAVRIGRAGVLTGEARGVMRVRTSFAERQLPLSTDVNQRMIVASLDSRDPLFDQMIYSRGRFVIEASAHQPLLVPARPEIARVVEDCRR